MRLSMSCPTYRGRNICVIPFTFYTKKFCLKKFLCFCKLSLAKESLEIIFNFPVSSSILLFFVLPPILIVWAAFVFVFRALSIYGLVGFGFVLRVCSPSVGRLSVMKL